MVSKRACRRRAAAGTVSETENKNESVLYGLAALSSMSAGSNRVGRVLMRGLSLAGALIDADHQHALQNLESWKFFNQIII
jgi:hypothetical protein